MRALVIGLLLVQPLAAKDILKNGGVKSPQGWTNTGGSATTTFKLDRKTGKAKKGSLYLANTNADEKIAHNWRTRFDAPAGRPYRLKLTAQIRTKGMAIGAKANVMVQLWPKQGNPVGYARCVQVSEDTDWKEIHAVFEVPEACATVAVLAYLVGKGEVWFDDFAVTKTKDDLTAAPTGGGGDDKYWKLARDCAKEIPWLFDTDAAKARAKKERKPILLYVRSTDDRDGLESASKTLRAEKVPNRDDGFRKDVLFRAGPLSDPDVAELITRRFVPLLLTYHFASHHQGSGRVGWLPDARGGKPLFDPKGHLVVTNKGKTALPAGWVQMLRMRGGHERLIPFRARIKTRGMASGSEVTVQLDVWGGDQPVSLGPKPITGNQDWRAIEGELKLPAKFTQVRLGLFLKGKGEAWFDDVSVTDRGVEQVFNGGIDPRLGADPLVAFGLSGNQVITPALVVVHNGKTRKLHRIGSLSTDLVDHFLRGALKETGARSRARSLKDLLADGELDAVVKKTAKARGRDLVARARALTRLGDLRGADAALDGQAGVDAARARAVVYLRRGEWDLARAEFSSTSGSRAAQFWQAWCDHRLARHEQARQAWKVLAKTDDRWGRRAAACVLAQGPRLWLSHTERTWPRSRALPEQSEGTNIDGFDAAQSVLLLIEFQNADGSFGSHQGATGFGFWDGTITAFAAEALWRWLDHLPGSAKRRAAAAHDRALGYLRKWTKRPYDRLDAFNAAYVLSYLVLVGERESGERLMPRIAKGQLPDGNWTVYNAARPASFNTALSVIALAEAKAAGWTVPEEVLQKGAKALAAMRKEGDLFPYSTGPGHEWMTTKHGSIARDTLCERALLLAGLGDKSKFGPALERYMEFAHELRLPTKAYYDYFNRRGHGGYYFFFAHRNALAAAKHASPAVRAKVTKYVRGQVLAAREGDGTFMDHSMNGRAYGTAQALILLAPDKRGK